MKQSIFMVFVLVISLVYFLGSYYVYNRGMQALPQGVIKTIFPYLFWFFTISFMAGMYLERGPATMFATIITRMGSFWIAALLYMLLLVVAIDMVRLLNHWFHFIPQEWTQTFLSGKWLFAATAAVVSVIVFAGYLNARSAQINNYEITIDKPGPDNGSGELKIALVTDIHMGFILGDNRVRKLVKNINKVKPDIVLLAGDLVDHNPLPVVKHDMGRHFTKVEAPLGIYAVTGNHEYIGKPDISVNYLSRFGITYVRDTMINVAGKLWIVGRDDKDKVNYVGVGRKPVSAIMNGHNYNEPVILIDHQPVEYDAVANLNVDLMVSGHTHKGQLWPFGYITRKVYENDMGLMRKNNTWFYTSQGYGTWGPPVRTGNRPEIAVITLKYNK